MRTLMHNLPSYSLSSCESLQLPYFSCRVLARRRYKNAQLFLVNRQAHGEFKMSRLSADTPLSFETIVHLHSMLDLDRRTRSKEWMSISLILLPQRCPRHKNWITVSTSHPCPERADNIMALPGNHLSSWNYYAFYNHMWPAIAHREVPRTAINS